MRVSLPLYGLVVCLCLAPFLQAQDAAKVDPKHYTVLSENDQVRILKVHYGPHEKSVMHSHPAAVAAFLTDAHGQFTYPDGKRDGSAIKSGAARYRAAATHLPEKRGDKGMDLIVVVLKAAHSAKTEMQ